MILQHMVLLLGWLSVQYLVLLELLQVARTVLRTYTNNNHDIFTATVLYVPHFYMHTLLICICGGTKQAFADYLSDSSLALCLFPSCSNPYCPAGTMSMKALCYNKLLQQALMQLQCNH